MNAVIGLAGQRFGRLLVKSRSDHRGGLARWICQCDCGTRVEAIGNNLRAGLSQSCGCTRIKHGHAKTKAHSAEYICWRNMRGRCEKPKIRNYKWYGARGIKVCKRWQKFENFLTDMGLRPRPDLTIERVNNDGNYEPGNCIWATQKVQANNQRRARKQASSHGVAA